MPWAHRLVMNLAKYGWDTSFIPKLFPSKMRLSMPIVSGLIVLIIFDFTLRVLPERVAKNTFERPVDNPRVTYVGRLADDYYRYYSQKLNDFKEGEKLEQETILPPAEMPQDKGARAENIYNISGLQLIGIFKGSEDFAVIRDRGDDEVRKVVVGAKIARFSVAMISEREVSLVGDQGDVTVLRLFDFKLSKVNRVIGSEL
jgi:hypothetical protein